MKNIKYKICKDCKKIIGIYQWYDRHTKDKDIQCLDCDLFNNNSSLQIEMLFKEAQNKVGNPNYVLDEAEGMWSNVVRNLEDKT